MNHFDNRIGWVKDFELGCWHILNAISKVVRYFKKEVRE